MDKTQVQVLNLFMIDDNEKEASALAILCFLCMSRICVSLSSEYLCVCLAANIKTTLPFKWLKNSRNYPEKVSETLSRVKHEVTKKQFPLTSGGVVCI